MERVICVVIGYVFGLFQTGYFYGKLNGVDLHTQGSGNSGSTNAMRVMGRMAGLIVFVGDVLKLCLACYVTIHLFNGGLFHTSQGYLLMLYTGVGVVLGHNYPFYLHFQGGKGIAVTAGLILMFGWPFVAVELTIFIVVVALTRYVSVGSITVVITQCFTWLIFGFTGVVSVTRSDFREIFVVLVLWAALAVWRHHDNIHRLLHGEENKLF